MAGYQDISLHQHCTNLFSINRSLMGDGTRETLLYFERFFPSFKRISFPSGLKVNDWEIPLEWNVKEAFIEHVQTRKRYAQFNINNLHLIGYSIPINTILKLTDLRKNLHFLKDQPDSIPYRTSYYKEDWGFCLSYEDYKNLPEGDYHVVIDSSFKKGSLDLSHSLIRGKIKDEIMFSSYICHPSMANNELSGPVILAALLEYLNNNYPNNYYSYRFVLSPETIGAIAYISKEYRILSRRLRAGLILTCLGDDGPYSIVQTPYQNTFADEIAMAYISSLRKTKTYSYLDRGSDERQYCAPNVDLPVCTLSRSKFGTFSEYHTSADNLDFISNTAMQSSFDQIKNIIDILEGGIYIRSTTLGEPQLGRRNLYRNLSTPLKSSSEKDRMNLIAYSNGTNSIFKICKICDISLDNAIAEVDLLVDAGILKRSYKPINRL
tara:strand:+ start:67532 stop:68839 length:1308 start_codon:yes stop_codon:yes gene_type:complete